MTVPSSFVVIVPVHQALTRGLFKAHRCSCNVEFFAARSQLPDATACVGLTEQGHTIQALGLRIPRYTALTGRRAR